MRLLLTFLLLITVAVPLSAAPPQKANAPTVARDEFHVMITPKMKRYAQTNYALYFVGTAYAIFLYWGVLASGLSAKMRDLAQRMAWMALPTYYLLLVLLLTALSAPFIYYSGYYLPHAYGLSHQPFILWLRDVAQGRLLNAAVAIAAFWALFALIRRSPQRWGLLAWSLALPVIAFGIFAEPILIDPLFNKFTPLPPGALRTQIHTLAVQAGIPNAPIYVSDQSRRTDTTNAYVTGIGASARIVIWDTTLKKLPTDEIVVIMGHEMGHYVLKHIYQGFAWTVCILLIVLPLAQTFATWLVRKYGPRWGIIGMTDIAAVPVLLLTYLLFSFLLSPLENGISRRVEHQADAYGLRVTHNGPAMARVFVYFSEHDLSDPAPPAFIKYWLFSHPPIQERIDFVLGRAH